MSRVDPAEIAAQRLAGWPDMHPEDYCHRCGVRNQIWYTDRAPWLAATSSWAAETGREGICCVNCLAAMHEEQTGGRVLWHLSIDGPEVELRREIDRLRELTRQACDALDECGGQWGPDAWATAERIRGVL